MIGPARWAGIALAVGAGAGTAWLSEAPWRTGSAAASLRVAVTVRPEQLEHCRRVPAEELAKLPPHMRQAVICEGRSASYRLEVRVDGAPVFERTLTGGGLKGDRPVHALQDLPVVPGTRRVTVAWHRIEAADSAAESVPEDSLPARDRRDSETRARRRLEAAPADMTMDDTVTVVAGRAVLVTYRPDTRRLALSVR